MNHLNNPIKLIICLFLIGYGQPVSSAVKETVPNIEALWRHYAVNEAGKLPTRNFPYEHCFRSAAQKYDLPMSLLLAVARGESNFNPRAKSDRNCHGLMQIQWPGTARHLGIYRLNALYEPCTNIRAGARYLRELLDRYNENLHLALAAYNYGPNRIDRGADAGRIPRGAIWYSGYIYHHLQNIMQTAHITAGSNVSDKTKVYQRQKRLALITFNQPYRANAYFQHLKKRAPSLNLDWYRIGLGRYQVVMLYSDIKTLETGRKKLKNLGVIVKAR
ncbi:MAG: lytic transglycosylase domain-containing protein [Deltaproteobacteria bacterium]|nr:lytic transglycosylase domain-containing protein [Deltaproteobacteria bacterium]